MTFLDWCLKGNEDDRDLRVTTEEGKVYEPGIEVPIEEVNHLKPMTVVGRPKLVDNIWHVHLR